MAARFSTATNFDDELPARLAPYSASEVFGKLTGDAVGGGRASYMLAPISRRKLESHVRAAHKARIEFNYLLNPACLGNREFTSAWQREFRKLLDWLSEIGVEWVTVSLPMLMEILKSQYPHVKVKVGVYAQVNSPTRARFWEDLGADCVSIDPLTTNRDFSRLQSIKQSVKCDLQLLANATCLKDCPLSPYHMVGLSHGSQVKGEKFMIDYCLLMCSAMKLADPINYLKSPWIRPEDLHIYEGMGYSSFKILERDAPSDALVNRTRAYYERGFDGNLIDLIQPYGYKESRSDSQPRRKRWWDLRAFVHPLKANPVRLIKWREFARMRGMIYQSEHSDPMKIDNRALDGFIEGLLERDCHGSNCETCGYCKKVAEEAIWIDPEYRAKCLELAKELLSDIRSGKIWST